MRADTWTGRLIGALARTDYGPTSPAQARHKIARDPRIDRLLGALARVYLDQAQKGLRPGVVIGGPRGWRALAVMGWATLIVGIAGGLVWLVWLVNVSVLGGPLVTTAGAFGAAAVVVAQAVTSLAPMVMAVAWRGAQRDVRSAYQVDQAHQTLARLASRQWQQEIHRQQLDASFPTGLTVADLDDHPESRGGRSHRVDGLVEEFRRRNRRLVMLGPPGAGKTSLVLLMVHELLRQDGPDQPIPVLLSIADWQPGRELLSDWLARRLTATHPALCEADSGSRVATTMIDQRRILPVLDGLDEMPKELRSKALAALNAEMTVNDPLILISRTADYEAAIRSGDAVLTGGAVIELGPLELRDAVDYLRGLLREGQLHGSGWPDLLSALANRNSPISEALTTPQVLWLLRSVYIGTVADPRELLDVDRFPTAANVIDHLFDRFVQMAITSRPVRSRQVWEPETALRWLGILADHLQAIGSRDIAWWRLHRIAPIRPLGRLAGGLMLGLVFGLIAGPAGALGGGLFGEPLAGLTGGLVVGFAGGLILGITARFTAKPAHANLRLRGRVHALIRRITIALAIGTAAGGLPSALVGELGTEPFAVVLTSGLTLGLVGGLVIGLLTWVSTPLPDDLTQTPFSTLHSDLRLMLFRMISVASLGGFVLGLLGGLEKTSLIVPTLGIEGVVGLLAIGGYRLSGTAGSVYLYTVTVLSLRRSAPRQMMRFLDHAHQVGLLRQVGPIYQFRNAALQARLAHTHREATLSSKT